VSSARFLATEHSFATILRHASICGLSMETYRLLNQSATFEAYKLIKEKQQAYISNDNNGKHI